PEEREQEQLLLARGEALRLVAELVQVRRRPLRPCAVRDQLDGPPDGRIDRSGRAAVAALDQVAELVDDGLVTGGGEHVKERLRGEDLADRRGERRPADLLAYPCELVEDL